MDFDNYPLFWGSVLSPVIFKSPEDERSTRQILLELTEKRFTHPDGSIKQYSLSTLKRNLHKYNNMGVEGLKPAVRSDYGAIRGGREASLERAIALKRANPWRSCFTINLMLRKENLEPVPESTMQRHLSQRGITKRKLGYEGVIIRKRWTRDHTHSLWVGDFSQGPDIVDGNGNTQKTWVSALIDVHSRFIVSGIYSLNSDMDCFVRSLQAAFALHGKPAALYLDNAKVYRSPVTTRACLELGIQLIHRTPYDPQGGGIIERFFLSMQSQFEREIVERGKNRTPLTLHRLNELFTAWVTEVYHKRRHGETGQTPLQRYKDGLLHDLVPLRPEEVRKAFYEKIYRTVNYDFCDISIDSKLYRVDPELRGNRVEVRYPKGTLKDIVEIRDKKGRKILGEGILHKREKRHVPDPPAVVEDDVDYAELLLELKRKGEKDRENQLPRSGKGREWDLATFITKICRLADCTTDSLLEEELEVIAQIHQKHRNMCMKKLRQIWQNCSSKNLSGLLLQLGKENV
ncbi:MAG: transposase family protein [Desulfamplus sp.]|nr:transposase family protein [Desulfamplus sp.]